MSNADVVHNILSQTIQEVALDQGLPAPDLKPESVLLQSGLDSLAFAVVIARLDAKLGYDPFLLEDAFYPRTYEDLLNLYIKHYTTKNI